MSTPNPTNETFADQLQAALEEKNVSVRELARRLNPKTPESARSAIHKWLREDNVPRRSSRRAVAEALGLPADHFLGVMPPLARPETRLLHDLIEALQMIESRRDQPIASHEQAMA